MQGYLSRNIHRFSFERLLFSFILKLLLKIYVFQRFNSIFEKIGLLVNPSVCRSDCQLVCRSVRRFVCWTVRLSVCRSVLRSVCPSVRRFVCRPVRRSVFWLVCQSVFRSVCRSVARLVCWSPYTYVIDATKAV